MLSFFPCYLFPGWIYIASGGLQEAPAIWAI
jgi:hypothetical protein